MILLNGEEVKFGKFPNGETHVISKFNAEELVDDITLISFKYEDDSDLIKLMFVKNHIDRLVTTPCELLIYYMPYSRMDRSEGGSVFTLKYIANFINSLGFQGVHIIEPHSDVTTALIDDARPLMLNEHLLTAVMNDVDFDIATDYIVYPDAGAQKRYSHMYGGNTIVAFKERDFETGRIKKLDLMGVPFPKQEGRKAIIVDDLCSKGGTFMLTAQALKEQGFDEIYLIVAHCEKTIFDGDIFKTDLIKKVFTTNSIISNDSLTWTNAQYKNDDRIEIIDVQDLIVIGDVE